MTLNWSRVPPQLRAREPKAIAGATVCGLVIGVVYALASPNWYRTTLSVVPATPTKGGGLSSQIAGALGGAFDIPELGVNADVERIAAVFESTSVTDAVIARFALMGRYDAPYIEHA